MYEFFLIVAFMAACTAIVAVFGSPFPNRRP